MFEKFAYPSCKFASNVWILPIISVIKLVYKYPQNVEAPQIGPKLKRNPLSHAATITYLRETWLYSSRQINRCWWSVITTKQLELYNQRCDIYFVYFSAESHLIFPWRSGGYPLCLSLCLCVCFGKPWPILGQIFHANAYTNAGRSLTTWPTTGGQQRRDMQIIESNWIESRRKNTGETTTEKGLATRPRHLLTD